MTNIAREINITVRNKIQNHIGYNVMAKIENTICIGLQRRIRYRIQNNIAGIKSSIWQNT